mgnify:CR=1 FL=1
MIKGNPSFSKTEGGISFIVIKQINCFPDGVYER